MDSTCGPVMFRKGQCPGQPGTGWLYCTWNRPVTLDTIAAQLPNGFHDALLRCIAVDYVDRRATLALNVCVGDPDGETDAQREAYRPAIVIISGLFWCIVEAPETNDELSDGLWIDAGPMSTLKRKAPIPPGGNGRIARMARRTAVKSNDYLRTRRAACVKNAALPQAHWGGGRCDGLDWDANCR